MAGRVFYRLVLFFEGLTLALLIGNMWLSKSNADLRRDVEQRQAAIDRGGALYELTVRIAGALGDIADQHDDRAIREMLFAEDPPGVKVRKQEKGP
jgi:hypothetical protein